MLGAGNVTINQTLKIPALEELRLEATMNKYILKVYGMTNGTRHFAGKTRGEAVNV